jgi:hypothetical protein
LQRSLRDLFSSLMDLSDFHIWRRMWRSMVSIFLSQQDTRSCLIQVSGFSMDEKRYSKKCLQHSAEDELSIVSRQNDTRQRDCHFAMSQELHISLVLYHSSRVSTISTLLVAMRLSRATKRNSQNMLSSVLRHCHLVYDFLVGKILRIVSECFHSYSKTIIPMMWQSCSLMRVSVSEHDITVLTHSITLSVSEDRSGRVSISIIRGRMWISWWRY